MAREQVGLRIRGDAPWEAHTELVVRCVLRVLSDRVERLTVLSSDEGRESRRLLINFKPLVRAWRAGRGDARRWLRGRGRA